MGHQGDQYDISAIQAYWRERAEREQQSPTATLPDLNLRTLEIEAISQHLSKDDIVLDIGCGNAYSTCKFARHVRWILGLDYSHTMIYSARSLVASDRLQSKISLAVGSVLAIPASDASFSTVISERCLINLPTWQDQLASLRELHRILKPGGLLLMMEGTQGGLSHLNEMRIRLGLPQIQRAWHNLDFDEQQLESGIADLFNVITTQKFGVYYFLSRVFHPLFTAPEQPRYDSRINEIAMQIAREVSILDTISHVALFVLSKK